MLQNDDFVRWVELCLVKGVRDRNLDHLTFFEETIRADCDDTVLLGRQHLALFCLWLLYQVCECLLVTAFLFTKEVVIVVFIVIEVVVFAIDPLLCTQELAAIWISPRQEVLVFVGYLDLSDFATREDIVNIDLGPLSVLLLLLSFALHEQAGDLQGVRMHRFLGRLLRLLLRVLLSLFL